ncbi:hypothetical protein AWC38_SpisGene23328 [Stylophora pistillata]|uniref:Uncharacterized protein n=1 Tax=Stylophora pistillata TaxID=50429 RepID=A0A2B4R2V4_STYPI|nr:hypothetical protein AWC38_SpisGene23328 [Stylophora pistillata]
MYARKWLSNKLEVLQSIPSSDCATEVDLDRGKSPQVKTLGVFWSPVKDVFKFQVNQPAEKRDKTKRNFLKGIATLFDPLGLLTPYTVRAKILLQEMWASGVDWDEPVGENLSQQAIQWFNKMPALYSLKVPRCLRDPTTIEEMTMHTFVDSSQEAYGAACYVRHLYKDGTVSSRLVASKSRVAPLQAVSIPRLELMAAVVGLKLAETVGQVLCIDKSKWVFWSDSMDVLHWIRGQSRKFKPFVANLVGEIEASTNPEQWRFVPTKQNPSDLLTRGLSVSALAEEDKWWSGPTFLKQDPSEWPENKIETKRVLDVEMRKSHQMKRRTEERAFLSSSSEDRLEPRRYSSWNIIKNWIIG